MLNQYSEEARNQAYLTLSEEQKKVLDKHIKRGRKTEWLNAWAKKKGNVLTEEELENPQESMERLLDWVLLDYEDALTVSSDLRCECGRPLRHRYTVLHQDTGKTYKLGIVHFEQHTGLSPEMVRLIIKGLKQIDLERVEILSKVIRKWQLPLIIPKDFKIPNDMVEQLRVKLPLLDRQIARLKKKLYETAFQTEQPKRYFEDKSIETKGYEIKTKADYQDSSNQKEAYGVEPRLLYSKLKNYRINASEARALFLFIKYRSSEFNYYGIIKEDIKKDVLKALGNIRDRDIRHWLIEIEEAVMKY
ncbi:MAG: hypothetical protein ACYCX4_00140 [Bacillota bacterium]